MSEDPVYCECLKIVTSLRECPVHGMFATASRRVQLEAEVERLRAALERIRRDEGKVCAEFTECEHRACQSSYTAWAIADEALQRSISGVTEPMKVRT